MKKFIARFALVLIVFPLTTLKASDVEDSLYQLVTFVWNGESQKLDFVGTGSGTSIEVDTTNRFMSRDERSGIITNKHVIMVGDEVADFVLLCPQKDMSAYLKINCNVPAVVTAVHPELDLAIVKPLAEDFFLLPTAVMEYQNIVGDKVRLMGYPSPDEALAGGGSKAVFNAFKDWNKTGGVFEIEGTNPTVTRGEIVDISNQQGSTRKVYYLTSAKGNFGLSGGAAFSTSGRFVGLPTLINQDNDTFVLAYILLEEWITENMQKSPVVASYITDYYKARVNGKTRNYDNINIKERFVETTVESLSDINKLSKEGRAAKYLFDKGIISGRPDGRFDGEATVNRAELAKFLLLSNGTEVKKAPNSGFNDLAVGAWYLDFVNKASQLKIISGYPDGSYKPGKTVNTAEFLKMLTLSLDLKTDLEHHYKDVNQSDWFNQYAGIAAMFNLFPDRNETRLEPGRELTRNEVAVAIWTVLNTKDIITEIVEDFSDREAITITSDKTGIELTRAATKAMPMVEVVEGSPRCELDNKKNQKYINANKGVYWRCNLTAYFNNPFAYLAIKAHETIAQKGSTVMPVPLFADMPPSSIQVMGSKGEEAEFKVWVSVPSEQSINSYRLQLPVIMADKDSIVEIANLEPIKKADYDRLQKYKLDLHNVSDTQIIEKYGLPSTIERAMTDSVAIEHWRYANGTQFLMIGGKVQMWDL